MQSALAHSAHGVVIRPHISEKSVQKNQEGKYVFETAPGVSKKQISGAIETLYGVRVKKVNKITTADKPIRYQRHQGRKSRYNKAVITLEKGQGIEVLPQ